MFGLWMWFHNRCATGIYCKRLGASLTCMPIRNVFYCIIAVDSMLLFYNAAFVFRTALISYVCHAAKFVYILYVKSCNFQANFNYV